MTTAVTTAVTAAPVLENWANPETVYGELMEEITYALKHRPRELQKQIGPSEYGDPCDRALIGKLMQLPDGQEEEPVNWRAWVGSCMHAGLEDIFAHSFMQQGPDGPRYLLERKVTVGRIGDFDLTGSLDLYDTVSCGVWDYKSKSATRLLEAKRHGMGQKYRVQFHSYGMGMVNAGYPVNYVGGIFMLRDGEFSDSFPLFEPYNPQIVIDALARANRLWALGHLLGAEFAMAQFPTCDQDLCRVCPGNYRPPFGPPRPAPPKTLAAAIAAGTPLIRRN